METINDLQTTEGRLSPYRAQELARIKINPKVVKMFKYAYLFLGLVLIVMWVAHFFAQQSLDSLHMKNEMRQSIALGLANNK